MSLDIRFKEIRPVLCPHCGQLVTLEEVSSVSSGGRDWYPILEKIGYYVSYEQRTEENDWYGKDMALDREQTEEVYQYIKKHTDLYEGREIAMLIAEALLEGYTVVVNADW